MKNGEFNMRFIPRKTKVKTTIYRNFTVMDVLLMLIGVTISVVLFTTNIFDDKILNNIPCFDKVYKYIVENKLQNMIVEFAYFDKPVGINQENMIIYKRNWHH